MANNMTNKIIKSRIWELDFLRGMALIYMIYYHLIFDLEQFYGFPAFTESAFNIIASKAAGSLFIIVSGISCSLSRSNLKRGLKVLGLAMLFTAITHAYDPTFGIKFGILHLLGICMLLSVILIKLDAILLFIGAIVIIALNHVVLKISVNYDWLFPFGISSNSFVSSDYYPLVPWFGVFMLGILLGKLFYKDKLSLIKRKMPKNLINIAGRYTLWIYLLHQPVTLGILWILLHRT